MRRPNIQLRNVIKAMLIIIFVLALLGVSAKVAYPYMAGPRIVSYQYEELGEIYSLRGTTTRTKILRIQGQNISIDPAGAFSTQIVKQYPYTVLLIEARDRFDHSLIIKKEI